MPSVHAGNIDTSVESFIGRWSKSSGSERSNYALFLSELCDLISVARPEPAQEDRKLNDYVFERSVDKKNSDGRQTTGFIDLYKRNCFVLEAKQSRMKDGKKQIPGQSDLFVPEEMESRGRRTATRAWDALMINARHQAEEYAKALPPNHGWPPFVLVCDVAHCIEIFADFSGQGKNYAQFPDRQGFRIFLEDLRDADIRERLQKIWEEPDALDPTRHAAQVTREIAKRLAEVSKSLETRDFAAQDVAMFLMRCLFTMFAEDVKLLPENSFTDLLQRCAEEPSKFQHMVGQLWQAMDTGEFAYAIEQKVKQFNGKLFASAQVLPLEREEIGELVAAAKADWREVEPAIFGTLLEQALGKEERKRLGAHYTPRAYVERLVVATIIEPLREDWVSVQGAAERLKAEGKAKEALKTVQTFHDQLCKTRVLDPACGTGNFLYVSLELMKRLEGEVLEALVDLGGQEALSGLEGHTVDPHQFLGLEINPRAAAITELVIWLGYLQWHFRTKGSAPKEPILRDFETIQVMDAVLTWDGYPLPKIERDDDGNAVETYPDARKPDWPQVEFIVGNPPFIGGKDIRARLGDAYTETLWKVHSKINDSTDLVMYWWDRAATLFTRKGSSLRRFGLVTTNSITQVFNRRVVARHLEGKEPMSLLMAIPDHPWTKATREAAAVRIAMTAVGHGNRIGRLSEVVSEHNLDTDQPVIGFTEQQGQINPDLTTGINLTTSLPIRSNEGLCSRGVSLHGSGFIVTPEEAAHLGLGRRPGLENHIRRYRNGRDLTARPRGVIVIDLFGLEADAVRKQYPEVYQHVLTKVKPQRQAQFDKSGTKDSKEYLDRWWTFGKPREELRAAIATLPRYIATVEKSKHRFFQFLDIQILPDNMLVCMGLDDSFYLGVLSSRIQVAWALLGGGTLEDRPRYTKSRCFDPFPFPDAPDDIKAEIRGLAEELDAHRKARQAEHPKLTLTQMYNVLEKLKADEELTDDDKRIKDEGLVLILRELHEKLDQAVFKAYGWPETLRDEEILERLVALNAERVAEEKQGKVRWLRPDYQIPKFGKPEEKEQIAAELSLPEAEAKKPLFPTDDEVAETVSIMGILAASNQPMTIADICAAFRQGRKVEKRVALTLLALARLGHLSSPDDGQRYTLRSVA